MNIEERVRTYLIQSAAVKLKIAEGDVRPILAAADLMANAFKSGNKLLLCGNGGSAADCQHVAAEFVGRLTKEYVRPGLPAIALTTDTSFLTAHANDCEFDSVFERQVQALGRPGDVLIGISTSGNSVNVIRAIAAARAAEMRVIGLTGSGGQLMSLTDICITVPSSNTQSIQEAHLAIEHVLCELVERALQAREG